jgi:hypothetical protein
MSERVFRNIVDDWSELFILVLKETSHHFEYLPLVFDVCSRTEIDAEGREYTCQSHFYQKEQITNEMSILVGYYKQMPIRKNGRLVVWEKEVMTIKKEYYKPWDGLPVQCPYFYNFIEEEDVFHECDILLNQMKDVLTIDIEINNKKYIYYDEEIEKFCKNICAKKIQRQLRKSMYDPKYKMCKSILRKNYEDVK